MLFSHISDTHLGLIQYGLEEREQDIYDSFNQAIDISIKDHVNFVIFAGDLFHVPNPNGTAIIQMANALKRLKQANIDSFFILGEHDVSRIRATPIPYIYHNLEFSRYLGHGNPTYYKDVMLVGFDKIRKNEITNYEDKFKETENLAKQHQGHRILVMHQGITDINKFAGEMNSTDLPPSFTYYAMGHLHDKFIKKYNHLNGPVAYPGSIDLTTSEGIKDTKKGFFQVDISTKEAKTNWIELDIRQQISQKTSFDDLDNTILEISKKITSDKKKPIVELKIHGKDVDPNSIRLKTSQLASNCLYCNWKLLQNDNTSSVLQEKPTKIDEELFKLAINSLKSQELASFAVHDLLPLLSSNQTEDALQLIIEDFEKFKKVKKND